VTGTPDLEATERIPTLPEDDREPPPRRGPNLGGLGRLLVLLALIVGGLLAAALLITPPRESVLVLGPMPGQARSSSRVGRTDALLLWSPTAPPRACWFRCRAVCGECARHDGARQRGPAGGSQTASTVSNVLGQSVDQVIS
jgi:hypothetical protein